MEESVSTIVQSYFKWKTDGHMVAACPEPPPQEHRVGRAYAIKAEEAQNNNNYFIEGKSFDNKLLSYVQDLILTIQNLRYDISR